MSRFAGKTALVTGGRSGIGRACAKALANGGARVFTAQRGAEPEFEGIEADFMDPAVPAMIISNIIAKAGSLDILVNNAGLMREGTVLEMDEADWAATMQVNLTAPYLLTKAALAPPDQNGWIDRQHWVNRGDWDQTPAIQPIARQKPACTA